MTWPNLVVVSDSVLLLGCVWCACMSVTSDGVQMSVCILGFSAGSVFGMFGGGGSVWCGDV